MKILHCITGLTPDGAQRMLLRLASNLQSRGYSNMVMTLSGEEPLADDFRARGIAVVPLSLQRSVRGGVPVVQAARMLRRWKPDLLQGWMYHSNLALSLFHAVAGRKVPLVWNIRRSLDDARELKWLTRGVVGASALLSSYADRVIYCTERSQKQHQLAGFCPVNGVVMGNGFDGEIFKPSSRVRAERRREWGIPDDAVVIGNVGRDDVAKGREFLLEAFAEVLTSFANAFLVVVGRGMDERNTTLVHEVRRLGIAHRVVLMGPQADPSEIYPAFDIYCSSSISEGFPNVIAEAMSSELPVVATDVGSSRDLVDETGMVVSPRSSRVLATALERMIVEGQSAWRERGVRARRRITDRFALGGVATQYSDLYQEIVRTRGAAQVKS